MLQEHDCPCLKGPKDRTRNLYAVVHVLVRARVLAPVILLIARMCTHARNNPGESQS